VFNNIPTTFLNEDELKYGLTAEYTFDLPENPIVPAEAQHTFANAHSILV
jgi:hypothetical protein